MSVLKALYSAQILTYISAYKINAVISTKISWFAARNSSRIASDNMQCTKNLITLSK